ncbi:MAG: PKD domain-containing protein [Gammaproteobacteria bacterium]|nr:PKD domain-containing protein [Gammaproteobacteria bacterium]
MAEPIAAFLAWTPLQILRGMVLLIVCLVLSLGAGSVSANQSPTIILTLSSTSGMAPFDVVFDASQSTDNDGSIMRFDWQFGDGAGAEGPTALHRFVVAGEYTVMLSALDNEGAVSRAFVTINVDPRTIPFASFAYSVTGRPLEIRFDASYSKSERPVVSYQWNFGDGTDPVTCAPASEPGPPGGGPGTRPPGSQPGGWGGSGTRPPPSQPAAPGGPGTRPPATQPGAAADDSAA